MPFLTIIVPVYNKESYLSECLDSLISQTFEDIEIIVVDNGSTDRSCEILSEYSRKDSRIVVCHENVPGPSAARNRGLFLATGRYLTFVDADDKVEPMLAAAIHAAVESCTSDVLLYGFDSINPNDELCNPCMPNLPDYSVTPRELGDELFVCTTPSVCTKAFNRELIEHRKISFNESIRFGEDLLFSHIALLHADSLVRVLDEPLYHYRQSVEHSLSIDRIRVNGSLQVMEALRLLYEEVLSSSNVPCGQAALLKRALLEFDYAWSQSASCDEFSDVYESFVGIFGRLLDDDLIESVRMDSCKVLKRGRSYNEYLFSLIKLMESANKASERELAYLDERARSLEDERDALRHECDQLKSSAAFKLGKVIVSPASRIRSMMQG